MKWLSENVAAVAQVFNGKTPSRDEQRAAGHAVLKIKDVDEFGCFRGTFSGFVDHALAEKHRKKQILGGETLVLNAAHSASHVASKTFFAANAVVGAIATGEWLVVRWDKSKVDERYGNHWINSTDTRFKLRQLINGIHLYPRDVGGLEIPLPPLPEQKRIAGILDAADALRAKRREALAQLDTLLQSTFLDMFGDPIINPMSFPIRTLSDFYVNERDGTKCGPFGSALKKDELVESGIPVWNMDNIDPVGRPVFPFRMWITQEKFRNLKAYTVIDGDVIISRAGTVGKMCVAKSDADASVISTNLIRVRFGPELLPIYFVSLMTYCKGRVGRLKTGPDGAFTHMSTGVLDKLRFPYPPMDLQHRFAAIVESVEQQKARMRAHLTELDALFASLQSRAFSGTL